VLQTGNTSLGVTLLSVLVEQAAARLADWDVEVVEMHHRLKKDAPSGTALLLGEAAAAGRSVPLIPETDRDQLRSDGAIGFASLRGGTVTGDHSVILAGPHERITLGHVAEDRSLFAHGAIRAALWLRDRAPGRYTMRDVLGL
jgi:4-hydroxy-tetrahydrodipicolinate reductase